MLGPPRAYVSVSPLVTYGKRKSSTRAGPGPGPHPAHLPRCSPGLRCTRFSAPAPSASRSGWPAGTGTTCLRGGGSETPRAAAPPGPARPQPLPRALTEGVEEVRDFLDGAGDHLDVLAVGPVLVDLPLHRVLLHRHGRRRRRACAGAAPRPPGASGPRCLGAWPGPAALLAAVRVAAARLLRDGLPSVPELHPRPPSPR